VNEGVGAGVMVNVVVRLGVGTFVFEVVFVQVQGCVWVLPVEIVGVSVIDRVGAGVIVNERTVTPSVSATVFRAA